MSANTFGSLFSITTCGESHGISLLGIVDGCPSGLPLDESDIQFELDRRKPGQSSYTTQRKELDEVRIVSGVFEGVTTGTSIGMIVENTDQKSKDYSDIKDIYRPGHADYTYDKKYGFRDYRGGGRSSARETVMRVAAGAIAKKWLKYHYNIEIRACVSQIGHLAVSNPFNWSIVNENAFFSPDVSIVSEWESLIRQIRGEGDSIGALVSVEALNVPAGIGDPVFEKLDALLSSALMSINAAKAVSIGDGFQVVAQRGSEHRDEITAEGFESNHAGGILGGISSGQPIKAQVAFKPTSSIIKPGRSINRYGEEVSVVTKGRHDPCVGIRAVPIVEAMTALVLMDRILYWIPR